MSYGPSSGVPVVSSEVLAEQTSCEVEESGIEPFGRLGPLVLQPLLAFVAFAAFAAFSASVAADAFAASVASVAFVGTAFVVEP